MVMFPFDNPVTVQTTVAVPPGTSVTLDAEQTTRRADGRETTEFRFMMPVKPFRLVNVIVNVPVEPWTIVSELGLTAMLKSPTLTFTASVVWVREPLAPVTVTV